MYLKSFRKHIALCCLIFFVGIKFIGLHALSHYDDIHYSDCEVCEYVVTSNKTSFIAEELITLELPFEHHFQKQLFYGYSYQFEQRQIDQALFSRPPPVA